MTLLRGSTRDKPLRCKQASWEGLGGHPNRMEATGLQCGAYIRTSHPTRAVRRSSSLCWGQFLALKRATSSTPTDPQIEVPGTYAIETLPLGPLWVSDVPGLVLGPSFGLLGSQTPRVSAPSVGRSELRSGFPGWFVRVR